MNIRRFFYLFHRCVLQRLHRRFAPFDPIKAKPIGNYVQPSRKLIGVLQCHEFFVDLEESVLRNFFSNVEITDLSPRECVNTFLVFSDQGGKCLVVAIQNSVNQLNVVVNHQNTPEKKR